MLRVISLFVLVCSRCSVVLLNVLPIFSMFCHFFGKKNPEMFLFCTYYGKPEEKVIREISDFLPEPMGKKESFILSLLFSLDNDMRTWPGGGSFRLPGIVFCTNALCIVYNFCT